MTTHPIPPLLQSKRGGQGVSFGLKVLDISQKSKNTKFAKV